MKDKKTPDPASEPIQNPLKKFSDMLDRQHSERMRLVEIGRKALDEANNEVPFTEQVHEIARLLAVHDHYTSILSGRGIPPKSEEQAQELRDALIHTRRELNRKLRDVVK